MEQQHHHYMRPPPPPPSSDPYQRPPLPPNHNHPWNSSYSTPPPPPHQFQYQTQPHHSPSPPPPPQQWPQPPPPYGHHPPPPYPGNPHYPPPRPPHHHQPPYPHQAQDWANGSWNQHQSWQYPNNSNEEDWAAKARAWAASNSAMDNQQPQSQIVAAPRPEGHHHFQNQFSQPYDPQFSDAHRQLAPASTYEQYSAEMGPTNGSDVGQPQVAHYPSSGQSSYVADMHMSYAAPGGSSAGNSTAPTTPYPQHDISSMNSSVHQQEVPSSYSSVAGNEAGNRYDAFNSSSSRPALQHLGQPMASATGRSRWMDEPNHLGGSQPAETVADPSDQPLSFAPHFNRNLDPHDQLNYTHSSGGPIQSVDPAANSSNYGWPPSSAPGVFYPPAAANISSGPQADHPMALPSPAPGHPTMFPTGPGFPTNPPMVGAAFGVGSGVTPHPAFSGDAYGISGISDRPKKASVPNWLREEIIKNKAVITSSALEVTREDSESVEDDINDKFSTRDRADNRSMDSSRSAEEENDDEEEVEAARTAAINQEIKRILTEVLLKVTDELFDEIATKVLSEDDLPIEAANDIALSDNKVVPATQATLTPKAPARVLIPTKAHAVDDASENSGSVGDILGLGSYASDEEDQEIQHSGNLQTKGNSKHLHSSPSKNLQDRSTLQNGSSNEARVEQSNYPSKLKADATGRSPVIATVSAELNEAGAVGESRHGSDSPKYKSLAEKYSDRNERSGGSLITTSPENDSSQTSNIKSRSEKNGHENKRSSIPKDDPRSESLKERSGKRGDEGNRRQDERYKRDEKTDYHDGSKDKRKEKGRAEEKTKDSESRKRRSPGDDYEGALHTGKHKRTRDKEDRDEKRRDKNRDEKKERSRHNGSDSSSRHKRHRSPSVDGRERDIKKKSVVGHASDYSDQSSDESRRRSRHSRRHKSPSPIRARKRQVSRSPHSKHSKRRHSPYSSLETTRRKRSPSRSRSRSPAHRRR